MTVKSFIVQAPGRAAVTWIECLLKTVNNLQIDFYYQFKIGLT